MDLLGVVALSESLEQLVVLDCGFAADVGIGLAARMVTVVDGTRLSANVLLLNVLCKVKTVTLLDSHGFQRITLLLLFFAGLVYVDLQVDVHVFFHH